MKTATELICHVCSIHQKFVLFSAESMSQDSEISIISESGNESKPHLKASHLSAFNPLSNPSLASHYTFYCYNISVSRGQLHNYLYPPPRSGPYHVICAGLPITSPMKSSIFRQKDRKTERQKDRKTGRGGSSQHLIYFSGDL